MQDSAGIKRCKTVMLKLASTLTGLEDKETMRSMMAPRYF